MPASNTETNFGWVSKCLHWLTALLIITTIPIALIAKELSHGSGPAVAFAGFLFSYHKTLGVALFFVAIIRILWAITQPKPKPISGQKPLEHWLAGLAHWCLYISLVAVPLTGWIHHAATTGFSPILWPFGQDLPLIPKSESVATIFSYLHVYVEKILLFALIAHILGALKHHFIDKDATLKRMVTNPQVTIDHPKPNRAPLFAAIGIFCVVSALALAQSAKRITFDALYEKPVFWQDQGSDWQVQEGSIAISVSQFGNPITGAFSDWTAAIEFDPEVTLGHAGTVQVQIAIPSLTLGSVSDQAMGGDYFDAATFPVATYNAKLTALPNDTLTTTLPKRYLSTGTLSLKGAERPVSFNFFLSQVDGGLKMTGAVPLQRLDFGIGETMPTGDTLGLAVDVDINLTAQRAD